MSSRSYSRDREIEKETEKKKEREREKQSLAERTDIIFHTRLRAASLSSPGLYHTRVRSHVSLEERRPVEGFSANFAR